MLKSLDRDSIKSEVYIDESYLEYQIFSIIKCDLQGLIKLKASLTKEFHIAPSEIDKMPMWEFELYMTQLNEIVKEENDKQKKEMDKHHVNEYMEMARPRNMQKMMQNPVSNMAALQSGSKKFK